MAGTLYIIGTPIGNLEDITLRQLRLLKEVDFIAAEDTRVTRRLLSHFDLHTPLVSYHEHSGSAVAQQIAGRILNGENCGIVTDAGMPCISDPGEPLVRLCRSMGIAVEVVPGPSAVIAALALSGQHTARFTFEGFLSVNANARRTHLEGLRHELRTMIFYEAPHKLLRTLQDMAQVFGAARAVSLCRELTKVHEETFVTTIGAAIEHYTLTPPRGEFVLVVAGAEPAPSAQITPEAACALIQTQVAEGMGVREACRVVAEQTGLRRNALYTAYMKGDKHGTEQG